jgi:hypothetical protein
MARLIHTHAVFCCLTIESPTVRPPLGLGSRSCANAPDKNRNAPATKGVQTNHRKNGGRQVCRPPFSCRELID